MHHVLIVDEEEHLLSALEQNLFPDRDDIAILTASDGEEGLEHLKNSRVDLLISDIKMPGKIDGFQLILRAKEVAPDARVIIITAFGNNRVQNFAAKIGITHYIEKPFNTSELRDAVLEILDEKEGFQGVLSDLELTDIIQMLCLARRTALLHLKHRDHRGRIVFDNGDVVHGEFDDLVGVDAVYRMLALRQGDIFMQGDFKNDRKTIEIGWQDLLFEGVRLADEERADLGDESSDSEGADDGPGTDVGMGISPAELDQIIDAVGDEVEPVSSFFSEDELAEIEQAQATDDEDSDAVALPFATLTDDSDGDVETGSASADDFEFRGPFQRQASAMSPGITANRSPVARTGVSEAVLERSSPQLEAWLEKFAHQCPGLSQSSVVHAQQGRTLASVTPQAVLNDDSFAQVSGDIISAAQHAIDALGDDTLREMQVASGEHYILIRAIEGTAYHHIAVVSRSMSLGLILVLMRRMQEGLGAELESNDPP